MKKSPTNNTGWAVLRCTRHAAATDEPTPDDGVRRALIKKLMQARMAMRTVNSADELTAIRSRLDATKIALGEAGPVWWDDGAEDLSGQHPAMTPYALWWETLPDDVRQDAEMDLRGGPSPRIIERWTRFRRVRSDPDI